VELENGFSKYFDSNGIFEPVHIDDLIKYAYSGLIKKAFPYR
jgi:hypothetical protein